MTYLSLFWMFLKIGLFTLGGGYASLPLIQAAVVDTGYITMQEFTDIVAISGTIPGAVALDMSAFVGIKLLGIPGSVIATLGFVVPSFVIVLFFAFLYYRYKKLKVVNTVLGVLRPAVAAFIAAAGLKIAMMIVAGESVYRLTFFGLDTFALGGIALCVILLRVKKWHIHPMLLMLAAGVLGGLYYYFAAV